MTMDHRDITALFRDLTTAHVADACLRTGTEVRCAPSTLRALDPSNGAIVGRARPARHYGSVDVFLEALDLARPGDVLVVDNAGRDDEACVGDLVALEVKNAGLAGIVIWGLHRDTRDLLAIGLPVFSLGAYPSGPVRLDAHETDALRSARVGSWVVTDDDAVIGDADGVLFVPSRRAADIATTARAIRDTELAQAARMRHGVPLRAQLQFAEFLARRAASPGFTFRQHLRRIGGAVEE